MRTDRGKGPRHHATAPKPTPTPKESSKMITKPNLRRNGELAATGMEGGTGTAAKLTPGPRTTHSPRLKVQGVRE